MDDTVNPTKYPVFLHDSYLAWCDEQPVPAINDFGMNLMEIETADGGNQIEYHDQPADHHKIGLDEIDKYGVESEIGEIFDEDKIRAGK